MPIPATAAFTNSKQPKHFAFLEAWGFGQPNGHGRLNPEYSQTVLSKKHEILAFLESLPSDPALMPQWVEQCLALGALHGGWGDYRAYLAVRTEILEYRHSTSQRRIDPQYKGSYRLWTNWAFTHSLRVPADLAAFRVTQKAALDDASLHLGSKHSPLSDLYDPSAPVPEPSEEEKRTLQLNQEAGHIYDDFDQLETMAKVALAFGEDDKARPILNYGLRRMEAWGKEHPRTPKV